MLCAHGVTRKRFLDVRLGKAGEYIVAITGHNITLQQWSQEEGIWLQLNERWTLEGMLNHLRTIARP